MTKTGWTIWTLMHFLLLSWLKLTQTESLSHPVFLLKQREVKGAEGEKCNAPRWLFNSLGWLLIGE